MVPPPKYAPGHNKLQKIIFAMINRKKYKVSPYLKVYVLISCSSTKKASNFSICDFIASLLAHKRLIVA